MLKGRQLYRAGRQLASAPFGTIRLGEYANDLMVRLRQSLEGGQRELRCSRERNAQPIRALRAGKTTGSQLTAAQ